jgi:glycosyltransferase involved in cell wall biosynthesis
MTSLHIEGWTGVSHSYAMVNQYQLLELINHDFDLFHSQLPLHNAAWSAEKSFCGFDDQRRQKIQSIPTPADGMVADITYRIAFPYRFDASASRKLFVFGTSEVQHINGYVFENRLEEGLRNPNLRIVTPSQWSKVGFLKAGFDESRIDVVPHGVDPNIFKPLAQERRREVRQSLGLPDDAFVILSLGSMTMYKGVDMLIIAYAVLRQRYKHVRLVLKDARDLYGKAGVDVFDMLRKTRPDIITEELRSSITFISENLSLARLREIYASADCYASPYRSEGFNLPPLEAAACGVPVVMTKGGATDDYHDDSFALQVDGHKLTVGDITMIEPVIESLMEKLALLIENRAPTINRDRALRHIGAQLSWQTAVKKLVAVLRRPDP